MNGLWTEAEASLKKTIPSPGWQSIPGGDLACSILTPVMSYILVGPSLCRNPEWLEIAVETTFSIIDASLDIRKKYTANWRWLARWQDGTAQRLGTIRKKALELIKPLYDERRQAINKNDSRSDSGSEMFHDTVYWILGQKRADTSLKAVVDQQLFLTLASIHNTAGMLQSLLFDWIAHPEYHAEITAEINETLAEFETSGSEWTLKRVARMRKLDSFMKESIRVNPIGFSRNPETILHTTHSLIMGLNNSHRSAVRGQVSHVQGRIQLAGWYYVPLCRRRRLSRSKHISRTRQIRRIPVPLSSRKCRPKPISLCLRLGHESEFWRRSARLSRAISGGRGLEVRAHPAYHSIRD